MIEDATMFEEIKEASLDNDPVMDGFFSLAPLSLVADIMAEITQLMPHSILNLTGDNQMVSQQLAQILPDASIVSTYNDPNYLNDYCGESQGNLQFTFMEAPNNFFTNQFDFALSYNFFDWSSDQKKLFTGLQNALIPKGKALVYIPLINKLELFIELIGLHPSWRLDNHSLQPKVFLTKNEYLSMVEELGFGVLLNLIVQVPYTLSKTQIMYIFRKKYPYLNQLNPHRQKSFFDYVVSCLVMHSQSPTTIEYIVPTLKIMLIK